MRVIDRRGITRPFRNAEREPIAYTKSHADTDACARSAEDGYSPGPVLDADSVADAGSHSDAAAVRIAHAVAATVFQRFAGTGAERIEQRKTDCNTDYDGDCDTDTPSLAPAIAP